MSRPDPDRVRRHMMGLATLASAVAEQLSDEIADVADLTAAALEAGGKLMFCGNGGSAADAQHLATEYVVRFRSERAPLPAIALTTDTSLLTAAANDYGFQHVFARQVRALGRSGDLLFLHSTSGRSANLLEAAGAARDQNVGTVALLGSGGGPLRHLVDRVILLPAEHGAHAQELHLAIGHVICMLVERRLAARPAGGTSSAEGA